MIIETAKFLIEGQSIIDIKEYLKENGKTEKESETIIDCAFKLMLENVEISQELRTAWCLEAYRDIYRKLMETGDYNGAVRAVKEIASLAKIKTSSKQPDIDKKEALSELNKKRLSIVRK